MIFNGDAGDAMSFRCLKLKGLGEVEDFHLIESIILSFHNANLITLKKPIFSIFHFDNNNSAA